MDYIQPPVNEPIVRVALQGYAGTGKTHSALTFPNPIVVDFDNNLTAEQKEKFPSIPFWNSSFIIDIMKIPLDRVGHRPNRRKALLQFLVDEKDGALKYGADTTLVFDSWTAIQEAVDNYNEDNPTITKECKIDTLAFWGSKLKDSQKIIALIRGLRCNVVVTFHEIEARDPKTGTLNGKIRPLQAGSFQAELAKNFTFFFRTFCEEDKRDNKVEATTWWWQVGSDNQFDAISRPAFPNGVFKVEPHYDSIKKIMEIKK